MEVMQQVQTRLAKLTRSARIEEHRSIWRQDNHISGSKQCERNGSSNHQHGIRSSRFQKGCKKVSENQIMAQVVCSLSGKFESDIPPLKQKTVLSVTTTTDLKENQPQGKHTTN